MPKVALPRPTHAPSGDITSSHSRKWSETTIGGEPVEIPYRIYRGTHLSRDTYPALLALKTMRDLPD